MSPDATLSVRLALAAVLAVCLPAFARAQTYPDRNIKLVVPFPAGGPTDVAARLVVEQMSVRLKQSIIVENIAGAGGRTGSKAVAKAPPDGYTLMIGGTNLNAVVPALYKKLDYDPMKDLIPVASIANDSQVMVVPPSLPVKTLADFVGHAKANPGKVSAGSAYGIGAHFSIELLKVRTGTQILFVPYKGGAPAIQDVMGGHSQMTFNNKSVLLSLIQEGKLRALVVTSDERWPEIPDVPTIRESGYPGFPSYNWYGLLAPAGTPAAIIERLNSVVNDILRSPEAKASFARLGIDPKISTPKEFADVLVVQAKEWVGIVKETGIQLD